MFVACSLFSSALCAEGRWSGLAELGYNAFSGNSDGSSLNVGLTAAYKSKKWNSYIRAQSFTYKADDVVAANLIQLDAQSYHQTSARSYKFAGLRYQDDKLSGYRYQASLSTGFGRHLIDTETTKMNIDLGLGIRKAELADRSPGTDEAIVRSRLWLNRKISANADIDSWLLVEEGRLNTYYQAELKLNVAVSESVDLSASYSRRRNSDLPLDAASMTGYTTFSIAYRLN